MASPRVTSVETPFSWSPTTREYSRRQNGWNGDKRTVYPYVGHQAFSQGFQSVGVGGNKVAIDAPNSYSLQEFKGFDGIPPWSQAAYNQAYARFREKAVGESAELGVMFAEWKEALNLIGGSIVAITQAYRQARKGNFKRAASYMGIVDRDQIRKTRTWRSGSARSAANLWLGWAFGISPMVSDIHSAVSVLGQPVPFGFAKGTSRATLRRSTKGSGGQPNRFEEAKVNHRIQGEVWLTNYNLFLLNQLGLLNPATLLWEITPFSFMVDWFFKVGNFLASFTDWVGVQIRNPCVSHFLRYRDTVVWTQPYMVGGPQTAFGVSLIRGDIIHRPIPTLTVNGNLGTSVTRAASAVSILVNLLTSAYQRDVG